MSVRLSRRAFTLVATLPLLPLPARAHTATPPVALPTVDDVRAAIEEILDLENSGDIEALARRVHPGALQRYPGFVIAHWFRNREVETVELVSDTLTFVDLDAPSPAAGVLAGEAIHGYVEAEVAEIASDGTRVTVTRRYTQAGADVRWLFDEPGADPEAALAELRAGGMRTDFQLVSFPQRDIDVDAEAPEVWESFSRQETGNLGDDRSGYAIYTSSNGSADLLVYSWLRLDEGAFPGLAAWYAATGPVAPGIEALVGAPPVFITAPDLRLDVYTADDTFARVLAPAGEATDDRAVYAVQRDGTVWFNSVVALATDPELNIPTNFASSLPFVAV